MPLLAIDDLNIPYRLRRSKRARHLSMRVIQGGEIEVVVPLSAVNTAELNAFLNMHQAWMRKQHNRAQNQAFCWPKVWKHGESLPFQGKRIPISICFESKKQISVCYDSVAGMMVHCPVPLPEEYKLIKAVVEWYKLAAYHNAKRLIESYAPQMGVTASGLAIRGQRQRWGSLSPTGRISLNWLLMLAPPSVFEYVVVHELCHLRERRHNKAFWRFVARYFADYKAQELWLRKNGLLLSPPGE